MVHERKPKQFRNVKNPINTELGWDFTSMLKGKEYYDHEALIENRKKLLHKIGVPIDKSTGSYGKLPLFDFKHLKQYRPDIARKLKKLGLNPHVHTKIQLKKMTKTGLIRLVIKLEKFIVNHAYEMYKAKLPRLRTTKQKALPFRKTKRKKLTGAAKAKFLARMNKGRRKKGLKPIRSR